MHIYILCTDYGIVYRDFIFLYPNILCCILNYYSVFCCSVFDYILQYSILF